MEKVFIVYEQFEHYGTEYVNSVYKTEEAAEEAAEMLFAYNVVDNSCYNCYVRSYLLLNSYND